MTQKGPLTGQGPDFQSTDADTKVPACRAPRAPLRRSERERERRVGYKALRQNPAPTAKTTGNRAGRERNQSSSQRSQVTNVPGITESKNVHFVKSRQRESQQTWTCGAERWSPDRVGWGPPTPRWPLDSPSWTVPAQAFPSVYTLWGTTHRSKCRAFCEPPGLTLASSQETEAGTVLTKGDGRRGRPSTPVSSWSKPTATRDVALRMRLLSMDGVSDRGWTAVCGHRPEHRGSPPWLY